MVLLKELNDGIVHFVAGHPDGFLVHNARESDNGDFRGSSADVDNHVPDGRFDIEPDPNGCRHRFGNEVYLLRAGVFRGVPHVRDAAEHSGAKEVHLVAEPMAAAVGVGLDVEAAVGNMIVDIGGGTTEIAVIALSGIVNEESIRIAGDEMNNAIIQFFKKNHNILIGERTAEAIKCEVGSAMPLKEEISIRVKGRDLVNGIPKTTEASSVEIRESLSEPVSQIIEAVKLSLERTPPELSADILDRGIMLSGGGALLRGLDERLRLETQLPVHVSEDPLSAVVRGTGRILENLNKYSKVLLKSKRY